MSGFGKAWIIAARVGSAPHPPCIRINARRKPMESIMVRQWSVIAALAALTLGAGGAAMAQPESKSKRAQSAPLATVEAVQMPAWGGGGGAGPPPVPGMGPQEPRPGETGPGLRPRP